MSYFKFYLVQQSQYCSRCLWPPGDYWTDEIQVTFQYYRSTPRFEVIVGELVNLQRMFEILHTKVLALESKSINILSTAEFNVIQEFSERDRCKANVIFSPLVPYTATKSTYPLLLSFEKYFLPISLFSVKTITFYLFSGKMMTTDFATLLHQFLKIFLPRNKSRVLLSSRILTIQ